MSRLTRHALTAAAILIPAAVAAAAPGRSVVLDYDVGTRTATVLTANGRLIAVQTPSAPKIGSAVRLVGSRAVRPGTVAASLVQTGRVKRARVTAMVVARSGKKGLALAGPGATLIVRLDTKATPQARSPHESDRRPDVGSTVTADLTVDKAGNVTATNVKHVASAPARQVLEIEGSVMGIDPTARTIVLVDSQQGLTISYIVAVPPNVDITAFSIGKAAEIKVEKAADGTLTLRSVDDNDEGGDGDHRPGADEEEDRDKGAPVSESNDDNDRGKSGGEGGDDADEAKRGKGVSERDDDHKNGDKGPKRNNKGGHRAG